jgi:hypothetical protein
LVLAEAAGCGMPPQAVALLDDLAFLLLGNNKPLRRTTASYMAGPLVRWQSHPDQPTHDRVLDVELLAQKQRVLIAFGGGPPGHMVGTAEIVVAMGNINSDRRMTPEEYYDVFTWASIDVLKAITSESEQQIRAEKKDWKEISDDDVLKPGGRLYATYQEIATNIRRNVIARMEEDSDSPRKVLRVLGAQVVAAHAKLREEAVAKEGKNSAMVRFLDSQVATIRKLYPDLATPAVENLRYVLNNDAERDAA